MVLCEDTECSVCLLPYTRLERIPRLLHCRHTFCQSCLETLSQSRAGLITVCCPLCRRVTCVRRSLGLTGALWVDSTLWDQIVEDDREEDKYQLKQDGALIHFFFLSLSARSSRTKLKFPAFLRRFSLSRQHQEQIIPGSNV
uniref:RING-type domain-containing protein n=1 Tax=Periophthalmus magnuspinnatus TaxID=409849 RepID=A0A3B4B263_9GOBI